MYPVTNCGKLLVMSKKIISFIFVLITLVFVFSENIPTVKAAGPVISISPIQLTTSYTNGVTITTTGLLTTKSYNFARQISFDSSKKGILQNETAGGPSVQNFSPHPDGTLSFLFCPTGSGSYVFRSTCDKNFPAGNYTILLFEDGNPNSAISTASFEVSAKTSAEIQFTNSNFTTSDEIKIKVNGLPDSSYKVLVNGKDSNNGGTCQNSNGGNFAYNLGKYYEGGPYNIQVFKNNSGISAVGGCGTGDLVAQGSFTISNKSDSPGSGTTTPTDTGVAPTATPCTDPKKCSSGGGKLIEGCNDPSKPGYDPKNPAIATAIGCIHTNPAALVKDLLTFIIGIAGGLSFLMMLLGVFGMLTSAGNPDSLNAGRERLTNAVIGLLFVIFAVLLLQIIGVGILDIPGFK